MMIAVASEMNIADNAPRQILRSMLPAVVGISMIAILSLTSASAEAQYRRHGHRQPHAHGHFGVAIFPPGLYMGAGLVGTRILGQHGGQELLEDGAGLSLFVGIRVSPQLALEGGVTSSLHNPERVHTAFGADVDYLVLNGATADAKIFFPGEGSSTVTPYAQGGLGLYLLDSDYFGTQSVGTGFQLGGGFDIELGPGLDLGLRALYKGISMGPPESTQDDTFISALSAEANFALRF
jgi:hypothetical protein